MSDNSQRKFDAKNALRAIGILDQLDNAAYDQISGLVTWKQYKKGAEVLPYKEASDEVYFIGSGRVRITIFSFSGKEISFQELGTGEIFGELSAVDQLPRTANVIVIESAQIGKMPRNDFWDMMRRHPSVAGAVLKRLASLVRFLADRVYQHGAMDVKDRIRAEVLRIAKANLTGDDFVSIKDFPTHSEIANRVNTHREAVTKELNKLSKIGLIKQSKRVLTISDINRLSELLSEEP